MGGIGSGRCWRWDAKSTTNDYRSIDVRRWAREGFLEPGRLFGWQWSIDDETVASIQARSEPGRVRLIYRSRSHGDEWESLDYPVRLLTTPCHYGGHRTWFACPARGCGRRVAVLYGGRIFACRHCYQLAYPSQREKSFERSQRRVEKIQERLGWSADPELMYGQKPKGMHWRTYHRLVEEMEHWDRESGLGFMVYVAERFGGLEL
ncbi:hypothetical protein FLO80_19900 [Aquicoccus porphyridii]|uniref:Uncharacterized protein n=1 Tax=Aquicoccus porphyridii TaxID=1852029 RepID=A0A5A9YY04_9RHOB|nr:hypothetical protein [Aquicoccus porphyridii]KAA0909831.1 hypothetical protein FLO80_19900 [Aquicoccus porphyridii]RAI51792.1 hypothetical protein DOO74_21280 [Rhodobacteraceae bacterium AsT-22]